MIPMQAPPTPHPTDAHPTDIECPTCGAWVGWACEGDDYGYHAAGYHPARFAETRRARKEIP